MAVSPLGLADVDVAISGGRVVGLYARGQHPQASATIDATGMLVLPGLVDPHTHIGYAGHRGMPLDALPDQYDSESSSALLGGVTTLVNIYRNESPYSEIFPEMRRAGEDRSRVDFAYTLGILNERQVDEIPRYFESLGVTSFKFYMAYRGVDSAASGNSSNRYTDGLLYDAMRKIARVPGGMAIVHAENVEIADAARAALIKRGRTDLPAWTESRPDVAEAESIRRALYFGEATGCPVYVAHVSSERGFDACLEHRARRTTPVYIEVCTHHLVHTNESALGVLGKVNPPLRAQADVDALWSGLAGSIDAVGSDHAAITREQKEPSIWEGTPGFAGVAVRLPVMLDAVRRGACSVEDVARVTSYGPARIFNLPGKGTLMVGADADVTIVDPSLKRTVRAAELLSSSDFSVYEGMELTGWPTLTMVGGQVVMRDGKIVAPGVRGRYLARFAPPAAFQ